MPEKHLYEYAVIRLVPRVEREEFLNVGVILYSQSLKFLRIQYHINHDKLHHFADNIENQRLYLLNGCSNTVTIINEAGSTDVVEYPFIGTYPSGIDYNPQSNEIYVANAQSNTVYHTNVGDIQASGQQGQK